MADASILSLVLAVPHLEGAQTMQAALTQFCVAHELFASVALSCIDTPPTETTIEELPGIMVAAMHRADSARSFGDATIGVGLVIGDMSMRVENMFSSGWKRHVFQVGITMLTTRAGIITWDIRTPDGLRYLTPRISDQGAPALNGLAERRGFDQRGHIMQVTSGILDNLVKSPVPLVDRGLVTLH